MTAPTNKFRFKVINNMRTLYVSLIQTLPLVFLGNNELLCLLAFFFFEERVSHLHAHHTNFTGISYQRGLTLLSGYTEAKGDPSSWLGFKCLGAQGAQSSTH